MTENELSIELKNGNISGMYFFWGDEDYMKNHRAAEIKKLVVGEDDSFASFNSFDFTFGDGELDLGALNDALLAPPMMMQQKLITVSFAALDSLKEKEKNALLELLAEHAENDYGDTVLIIKATSGGFDPGTAKKPAPFLTSAGKIMKCVEFAYQQDSRLIRWMSRHFSEYGLELPANVGQMIISACGKSMYRLIGEIGKIGAYAASRGATAVTPDDVYACVSRTEEDDAFRLANCILEGNTGEALKCLNTKMRKKEDPIFVLSQINKVFADLSVAAAFIADGRDKADYAKSLRMNEYRAGLYYRAANMADAKYFARAMERCCEADRQIKSGSVGYTAIERLICGK